MTSIQDLMRDAAAQQAYDLRERDRVVIAALNLARGKRAGDVIHLGDGPGDGTAVSPAAST